MTHIRDDVRALDLRSSVELPRRSPVETHLVIRDSDELLRLCHWAADQEYYLSTMTVCDERMLEDNVFKRYIVLSSPDGHLAILEQPLAPNSVEYLSFRRAFPAVRPLELAARDLFGLRPTNELVEETFWHHAPYPPDLYPLRKNRATEQLVAQFARHQPAVERVTPPPDGVVHLIVGPIHAGIIEPGQFRFHVAGEVVEDVDITLGYKNRGIEKLFETGFQLTTGQRLAECVSGDSSFVHSMAYCQAVESLVDVTLPEATHYWRALLLELERLYNHVGDVGALIHDIAFDLIASEAAVMRERLLRLNERLTGSRLLRGVNHPGGVGIDSPWRLPEVIAAVSQIADAFLALLGRHILTNPACRNRYLTTGVLTEGDVRAVGATGLPARASGLRGQDFRTRHPYGAFALDGIGDELRELVAQTFQDSRLAAQPSKAPRRVAVFPSDLSGDALARLLVRVAEVETSALIIRRLAESIEGLGEGTPTSLGSAFDQVLHRVASFEIGLGYAEGWRGDVFYFIMKGPGNTIFRCQPRDPSLYNWGALRRAVVRKKKEATTGNGHVRKTGVWENILADFPVINKSFNLSYAGYDG